MSTLYAAVLFVCMNGNCEFMQATNIFRTEAECRRNIDSQKENVRKMSLKGNSMITLLEGTCINVRGATL
jgi:hypothetical protein